MLRPNAEFWRLWGCALALSVVICAVFLAQPAEARGVARHHHHRHVAHPHRHHLAMHHRAHASAIARGAARGDAVSIAMRFLGSGNPTGTRGPWCGDFMNLLEHLSGRRGIASRMATAWASYGHASAPVRGAIAVFPSHVARVIAREGDRLEIISGNWSRRVGIGWVRLRSAVAFRMP